MSLLCLHVWAVSPMWVAARVLGAAVSCEHAHLCMRTCSRCSVNSGVAIGYVHVMNELDIPLTAAPLSFRHVMACEIHTKKRELIAQTYPLLETLFGDIEGVSREADYCHIANKIVRVPEVDVLTAGFSCKGLSCLNQLSPRTCLTDMSSTSTTLRGVFGYMKNRKPRGVILENVPKLCSASDDEMETMVEQLLQEAAALGYSGQWILVNSKNYLLPQSRPRVYIFMTLNSDPRFVLQAPSIMKLFEGIQTFALSDLLSKLTDTERAFGERGGEQWIKKHNVFAKDNGMPDLATQGKRDKALKTHFVGALTLTRRLRSCLLLQWVLAEKRGENPESRELVWEISQEARPH
jgi:site-specific DNA-cytosine methylase